MDPRWRDGIIRMVDRLGLSSMARTVSSALSAQARQQRRRNRDDLRLIAPQLKAVSAQIGAAFEGARGVALFISMTGIRNVLLQLPVIAGVAASGLEPVIILPSRASREELHLYALCGVRRFAYWDQAGPCGDWPRVLQTLNHCLDQDQLLELRWNGIAIGKYAVSTLMRRLRSGYIDLSDDTVRRQMELSLRRCLDHAAASLSLLEKWKPELVVFIDRGYTPEGPLFEASIARGVRPITLNAAHRDNALILKRYGQDNANVHPVSLSDKTWKQLTQMPWTDLHWQRLRGEFEHCYGSGQWYGEVATQFNTEILEKTKLLAKLNLDQGKRTVLLFPHIFWDATFFWGTDVFRDYEEWFRESVRAAWQNSKVNWIIKIHPANVVKNIRDGKTAKFSELQVLSEFGQIPPHIRLLPADTQISTLSVFAIGDVCLTVRGTVGIEAAAHGLTVVTAGTGRYDGLGFTIDARTKKDYLAILESVESLPAPTPHQTELAQRYAYGAFLVRPLEMSSIAFTYAKSRDAGLEVTVSPDAVVGLMDCPDILFIKSWLKSGEQDICSALASSGKAVHLLAV